MLLRTLPRSCIAPGRLTRHGDRVRETLSSGDIVTRRTHTGQPVVMIVPHMLDEESPPSVHQPPFQASTPLYEVLADRRGYEILLREVPDVVLSTNLHSHSLRLVLATEPALAGQSEAVRSHRLGAGCDRTQRTSAAPAARSRPGDDSGPRRRRFRAWAGTGHVAVRRSPSTPASSCGSMGRLAAIRSSRSSCAPRCVGRLARCPYPASTTATAGSSCGSCQSISASTPSSRSATRALSTGSPAPSPQANAARDAHGPVRVADTFHFAYADGTRMRPIGTTAYAWTHQGDELEQRTLATLCRDAVQQAADVRLPEVLLVQRERTGAVSVRGVSRGRLRSAATRPGVLGAPRTSHRSARRARYRGRPHPVPRIRPLGLLDDGAGCRRPLRQVRGIEARVVRQCLVVAGQ